MSRVIKFRGYDEENNCWIYGFYTKLLEGVRVIHAIIVEDEEAEDRFTRYYIHNKETITQFTGLQDKNGVDIYEGDIIKSILMKQFDYKGEDRGIKMIVKFGKHDTCSQDFYGQTALGWYAEESNGSQNSIITIFSDDDKIEIVGNIHEVEND